MAIEKILDSSFTLLKNEALIFLEGTDTRSFLQGQSSCDVRLLSPNFGLTGLFCTPKGRVLSDFLFIIIQESTIAVRLKKDLQETTELTLKKYAAFSQVEFRKESNDWQVAGCWGKNAKDVIFKLTGERLNGKGTKINKGNFHIIQMDDLGEHFECIFNPKETGELLGDFIEICNESSEKVWEEEIIKLGIARLSLASSEVHVPQVLNYDLNGFISFEKGCYTGQEIIARLKYRGTPKRRCFLANSEGKSAIIPGSDIYFADTEKVAGVIVNASSGYSESISSLISISENALTADLRAAHPTGPKLILGELPYKVIFN